MEHSAVEAPAAAMGRQCPSAKASRSTKPTDGLPGRVAAAKTGARKPKVQGPLRRPYPAPSTIAPNSPLSRNCAGTIGRIGSRMKPAVCRPRTMKSRPMLRDSALGTVPRRRPRSAQTAPTAAIEIKRPTVNAIPHMSSYRLPAVSDETMNGTGQQ